MIEEEGAGADLVGAPAQARHGVWASMFRGVTPERPPQDLLAYLIRPESGFDDVDEIGWFRFLDMSSETSGQFAIVLRAKPDVNPAQVLRSIVLIRIDSVRHPDGSVCYVGVEDVTNTAIWAVSERNGMLTP